MSSDGNYAYVSFLNGNVIQKIDTRTDAVVTNMNLGAGSWNILYLAPADTALVTSDWTSNGRVIFGNTGSMQTQPWLTGSGAGLFVYPHGIASTAAFDTCFITAQYGNVVYRFAPDIPDYKKVSINGRPAVATNNGDSTSPNPHEILMAPDYSKYFLTCQGTNEVRVLNAHNNAVLDSIQVGLFPQEMAMSLTHPYLFVTCMEDNANTRPGARGSVYVINYNTHEVIAKIYGDFYQPHAVTVDDRNNKVYIVSTNANPGGPTPHHATTCDGRPGWYSVYDLNTLQPINNRRYELTVMPYSAATRFKQ
jgi:DNA-binding beta-propeller fold protein YncE